METTLPSGRWQKFSGAAPAAAVCAAAAEKQIPPGVGRVAGAATDTALLKALWNVEEASGSDFALFLQERSKAVAGAPGFAGTEQVYRDQDGRCWRLLGARSELHKLVVLRSTARIPNEFPWPPGLQELGIDLALSGCLYDRRTGETDLRGMELPDSLDKLTLHHCYLAPQRGQPVFLPAVRHVAIQNDFLVNGRMTIRAGQATEILDLGGLPSGQRHHVVGPGLHLLITPGGDAIQLA